MTAEEWYVLGAMLTGIAIGIWIMMAVTIWIDISASRVRRRSEDDATDIIWRQAQEIKRLHEVNHDLARQLNILRTTVKNYHYAPK